VFNRWLIDVGPDFDPLPLLHNFTGVLIGMVHVLLPYMCCRSTVRCAGWTGAGRGRPKGWAPRAGGSSGAVYLPLTLPGIFAGSVIVFVLSLGFSSPRRCWAAARS
jgi:ABC-type molybdate transport system permease subunit